MVQICLTFYFFRYRTPYHITLQGSSPIQRCMPMKKQKYINKSYKKLLLDEQVKKIAAETKNASDVMSNLLDDDREEVAVTIATLLPLLNTTKLEEAEDANDRRK